MNIASTRAKRLPVVAAALTLTAAACASADGPAPPVPSDTTVEQSLAAPEKISVAGQVDAGSSEAEELEMSLAADQMWYPYVSTFVAAENLGPLPSASTGYKATITQEAAEDHAARVAAMFGFTDDPRADSSGEVAVWEYGDGDLASASLTVSMDGTNYWWYSPSWDDSEIAASCTETYDADSGETYVDCPEIETPTSTLTAAEAQKVVEQTLQDAGVQLEGLVFETFADDWFASVYAYRELMPDVSVSAETYSFSFDAAGDISWATGTMGSPTEFGPYPLIGLDEALERLAGNYMNSASPIYGASDAWTNELDDIVFEDMAVEPAEPAEVSRAMEESFAGSGGTATAEAPPEDMTYEEALQASLDLEGFTEQQSTCLTSKLMEVIAAEDLESAGIAPHELVDADLGSYGIFSEEQAAEMVSLLLDGSCNISAAEIIFAGADLGREQAECLTAEVIASDLVRSSLEKSLLGSSQEVDDIEASLEVFAMVESCGMSLEEMMLISGDLEEWEEEYVADDSFVEWERESLEEVVVTLEEVEPHLWMTLDSDGDVWILPAYKFTGDDGNSYVVPAVTDEYLSSEVIQGDSSEPGYPDPGSPDPDYSPGMEPSPLTDEDIAEVMSSMETLVNAGLSVQEMEALASEYGLSVRVIVQDGQSLMHTEDYVVTRLNVAVQGDSVTEIISNG